jgi:hypothetical protein
MRVFVLPRPRITSINAICHASKWVSLDLRPYQLKREHLIPWVILKKK